jgi:2-hydroxy-3-oxopropionate reductase
MRHGTVDQVEDRVTASTAAKRSVGVVGLGVMGRPIAANLLRAGYPVVVASRRRESADALVGEGATWCSTPAELAERVGTIITVVTDDDAVRAVVLGPSGVLRTAAPGSTVIDMSTIAPSTAREVAGLAEARGVRFLDAPVSGGQRGAEAGSLSIMVGGNADALEDVMPVLDVVADRVVHVGPTGSGQVAKAVNQVIVGLTIQAVAEGLALASASGADLERVREALLGGFAASRVLEEHGARMIRRDFAPGGRLALHLKDLRIASELAAEAGVPVPATEALERVMGDLVARGHADLDQSAVALAYEG